jgi:hypothetical protein
MQTNPAHRDNLNDSLDDLIFGAGTTVRTAPVRENAVEFKSAEQRFEENCPKCRGTGRFTGRNGRVFGNCFACKGQGKQTFRTSPEDRAKGRVATAVAKARDAAEVLAAFAAANPVIWAWLDANRATFDFAAKMVEDLVRFGSLTEGKMAACQRLADREAAKVAARVTALQQAPQVDTAGIDRLKAAFDKAREYTAAKATGLSLRNPKITIGGMTISPAKADSRNPGAIYVKQAGEYLGKIVDGKFIAVQTCTPAQRDQVLSFIADPAAAAKVYGQETGICCVCNAVLKSAWRLRGIGPICAKKMGWADLAEDFGVEV